MEWAPYIGYPFTAKLRQLNSITVYQKLKSLLNNEDIDIVNSLGGEAFFIPDLCKKRKIPFFVSLEHPNLKSIVPKINPAKPYQTVKSVLQTRELKICRYICDRATFIVSPSKFTKHEAVQYFDIDPEKVEIVHHGIVDEMLCRSSEKEGRSEKGPIIYFGRLEPQKGVDLLISVFALLVKNGTLADRNLLIIGNGPHKRKYEKLAVKLGLQNRIKFTGWQPHDYIKERLAVASCCVLPSISESFGLSMAETLAQGVPLVTTTAGSIPEVVDYGRGAWLAEPDDPLSLTETLKRAVMNYPESLRKANHGKAYALERFSWSEAARKYEALYQRTLGMI